MDNLLEISNLHIQFSGQPKSVIEDLSFSVSKGEILGIVGESGSGKSMTALSIMNLLPQPNLISRSGKADFVCSDGKKLDLFNLTERQVNNIIGKEICMIFQEPMTALNPVLTCGFQAGEQLRHHFSLSKSECKKKILEMFEKVKLDNAEKIFNSYPHQLSGGQRQRVMIAMAMSVNPSLLIADEPTTALDVTVQKEVLDLIRQLQKEFGTSVIFISHDLAVVKSISHNILVMRNGKIEEYKSTENIFKNPEAEYTRALLACRPKIGEKPPRLKSINDLMNAEQKTEILQSVKPDYSQKSILEVEKLNTWYLMGKNKRLPVWFKANEDISLQLFRNETLGIVGESGSGKSTLVRSILQLVRPNSGKVFFNDVDLCSLKESKMRAFRQKLQLIFQDPYSSLNPQMKILDALYEPMKVHSVFGSKRERLDYIEYILDKTGLSSDSLNKYPHQFSGGQRQRVVIARALVLKPEIVFCDESVAALDVSVQAQVLNLLNDLKRELNLTYVFISHDLNVINYMSDRILVMQKGKIVEQGFSNDVISNPQNDYTQKLIDSIPHL